MSRLVAALGMLMLGLGCPGRQVPETGLRVVSLVPSITETIYALGAERYLVGNTNQCDYPQAARSVYKVGDFMAPDLERIVALRPTLVFITLPLHRQLQEKLAELAIPVYVSRPADIHDVFAEIESVGVLVGARDRARVLVAQMRARLDSLPTFADTAGVYVEISSTPLMTAGGRTFISEMIAKAGGRNVFDNAAAEYPVIDPEMVVQRNPDVVLLLHPDAGKADVAARIGWSRIKAVGDGRVFDGLDEDLFFRPGPRVVDGVALLARLLHPER